MRSIGWLLIFLGIGSCVVHFMDLGMRLLGWIDTWGEGAAWGIRGGCIAVGLLMVVAGKSKQSK